MGLLQLSIKKIALLLDQKPEGEVRRRSFPAGAVLEGILLHFQKLVKGFGIYSNDLFNLLTAKNL